MAAWHWRASPAVTGVVSTVRHVGNCEVLRRRSASMGAGLPPAVIVVRRLAIWFVLLCAIAVTPTTARAMACPGTMIATSLSPISPGSAVEYRILPPSTENLALGESFAKGMREAGVITAEDGPLVLTIAFLVTQTISASPASTILRSDFAWMKELNRTKLQKADGRVGAHQPTLRLTASLLKKESVALMWVANVDCTIKTLDAHQLAHDRACRSLVILGKATYVRR
jgi:hypothetical protein